MPLTTLNVGVTAVSDLSPLRGMPLTTLYCYNTAVMDLSPLKGIPLATLSIYNTPVTDLSPLQELKLRELLFSPAKITRGLDVVRAMPSLQRVGIQSHATLAWPAEEFWKRYEKGEFK